MEGLGSPKTLKKQLFFKVFVDAGFRYFEALGGPLGPILGLWGRSGTKKAPKIGPQMALDGQQEAQAQLARALLEALVSKMAPRWLKMAPHSPR